MAAGGKINPAAIARPIIEMFEPVFKGKALQLAGRDRQNVDIAVSGERGFEGETFPVRRIKRARHGGGIRDQQAGFASGGGHGPNVSAADESNLRAIRRNSWFTESRLGCLGITGDGSVGRKNIRKKTDHDDETCYKHKTDWEFWQPGHWRTPFTFSIRTQIANGRGRIKCGGIITPV